MPEVCLCLGSSAGLAGTDRQQGSRATSRGRGGVSGADEFSRANSRRGEDMDNEFQRKVREFHDACGVVANERPTEADPSTRALRCRLLLEETKEFIRASGCTLIGAGDGVEVAILQGAEPDLNGMAQELADVQYVTSGAAVTFGIPLGAVFAEVHAANMRKAGPDGKVMKRPDGKVVKPDGWRGPDVAGVLARFNTKEKP